ncbi:MAG: glycosyltransferase family 39 protein [Elusimicrobiota bacterium]
MIKKIFYTLTFCWIAIVIFSYLIKFPLPNFTQHISELFFLFVLLFVSFQTGNFVLNKLELDLSTYLSIPFAVGIGLALFSTITFFLGIFGFLYKTIFYILILILSILSLRKLHNLKPYHGNTELQKHGKKHFNLKSFSVLPLFSASVVWFFTLFYTLKKLRTHRFHRLTQKEKSCEFNFQEIFLIIIFFVFFVVAFIGALTPPTFYDSLVYHLAIPSQYIKSHQIIKINTNLFSNFPQNIEMLYAMALILCNDIVANLIHFIFFPLICLSIYGFLRERYTNKIPIFASLIFSTTPAVVMLASGTYIDLGLTFYLFLSFVSLVKWTETAQNKWLILSGLLCGFSLGIKYTAGISAIIFILMILYSSFSKKQNFFLNIALFITPAFLVFLPWFVKNYIFTGNPVFPFYIFSSTPEYIQKYLSHVSQHGTKGFFDFLNLPWNITMEGVKFGGGFDIIGPFYLVFLPILFLITKTDKLTKLCFTYLVLYFFFWSLSAKVLRFLIPIFPVAAVVFSICIFEFINGRTLIRNIVKIVFSAIIVSNFAILIFIQNFITPLPQLFGNITKNDYLYSKVLNPNNFYPAVKFMNENLNTNSKTLFVGEARNYYTNFRTVASGPFDPDVFTNMANDSKTAEELLNKLRNAGFTNIFWNYEEYGRLKNGFRPNDFTEQSVEIVDTFEKKYLNLLYENKGLCVYSIKDE